MTIQDSKRAALVGYPDEYLVEEDEMGDSYPQGDLMFYLTQVLRWLYRYEGWVVATNLNHYHPAVENSQKLIVPDVVVFKGIPISSQELAKLTSWDMRRKDKLPPPVVIKVSSKQTYENDIEPEGKPRVYGLIGVREYFAYDPSLEQLWLERSSSRLLGWRYDAQRVAQPIEPDERGRLWSEVLESWLVEDGAYLRLYDRAGHLRRTASEAKDATIQTVEEARQSEQAARYVAEAQARAEAKARSMAEAQAKIEAEARNQAERRAVEAERRLAELEARLKEQQEQSKPE